jgi:DNA-dependent protein kinase catalytic subunit
VDQTLKQLSDQAARQAHEFPNRENLVETAPLLARYEKFVKLYPDAVVEIPGQYTGTMRPEVCLCTMYLVLKIDSKLCIFVFRQPALHVRIVGFQEQVSVMKSLRKPKAITALGDDQKEYKLLIKTGEDLRLDERVEDLFGTMNEIFGADPTCRRRRLRLQRYSVTPLTSTLGVLSWLPDSCTLDDLISDRNKAALSESKAQWEVWVREQWKVCFTNRELFCVIFFFTS